MRTRAGGSGGPPPDIFLKTPAGRAGYFYSIIFWPVRSAHAMMGHDSRSCRADLSGGGTAASEHAAACPKQSPDRALHSAGDRKQTPAAKGGPAGQTLLRSQK